MYLYTHLKLKSQFPYLKHKINFQHILNFEHCATYSSRLSPCNFGATSLGSSLRFHSYI